MTEFMPIIQKHPRSRDYDTESDFYTAHRRWRDALVYNFRRHVDDLEDEEGRGESDEEGEWRDAVENLCSLVEGDREAFFTLLKAWGWNWREAVGVWGIWFDVKFTRESLPYVGSLFG